MKESYNQQIESFLNFFNSLYFQSLTSGYSLLFADEFKDLRNDMDENQKVEIQPELLVSSNDKIVQVLGTFCKDILSKIEELSNLNNIDVATGEDLVNEMNEDTTYIAKGTSFKDQDYKKLYLKCTGTLLEFNLDMAEILEAVLCDLAGVTRVEVDPMTPIEARLENLRLYSDTNTSLLLDMSLILNNTVSDLLEEGTKNGLLKGISMGELLAIANEPD
ncbi:MAG: hypothetical protein ACO1N7_03335 [Sphingobacteriaceae bacterium]